LNNIYANTLFDDPQQTVKKGKGFVEETHTAKMIKHEIALLIDSLTCKHNVNRQQNKHNGIFIDRVNEELNHKHLNVIKKLFVIETNKN